MAIGALLYEALVEAAIAAPSSHNTQPWRFTPAGDAVELIADRSRALPVNDPHDRELTISCGCALHNLVRAAAALGLAPRVDALPDGPDADLLARVRLDPSPAAEATQRVPALPARHTWRGDVLRDPPDAPLRTRMRDAAFAVGVRLHELDRDQAHRAAELVDAGDRAQWTDPRWRRELALWMHGREAGDGLTVLGGVAPLTRTLVRATDLGRAVGPRDAATAHRAPWLGVVASANDAPADWLATGLALQAILLEAAAAGFQAGYLNQPIQVEALRLELARLCGGAFPQVMFRLGRPDGHPHATPRRPVAAVQAAPPH